MPSHKRKPALKGSIFLLLLLLGVAFLFFLGARNAGLLSWIAPGWEIYTQVSGLQHNGAKYVQSSQYTNPSELMGVYLKGDIDDPNFGVPTIMVTQSEVRHVDFAGQDLQDWSDYAETRAVTRGNHTYYLDYHIYMFTVTIRTIADKNLYRHVGLGNMPLWKHETSWPHEGWDYNTDGGFNDYIGEAFKGGAFVKFVISPWRGASYRTAPNSSYVLQGAWAGVMNAYAFQIEAGQVANQWGGTPDPNPDAPLFYKAGLPEGNMVPMLMDDGTYGDVAPRVTWDQVQAPDPRINSTVVLYIPCELQAGLKTHEDWKFMVDEIYPADVYVMFTLRIDVLQQHDFVLQGAYKPPEAKPPSDYFTWAESFWTVLLGGLNPFAMFGVWGPFVAFLCLLAGIGIIVLILLAIFAPRAFARLFKGLGTARKEWNRSNPKNEG